MAFNAMQYSAIRYQWKCSHHLSIRITENVVSRSLSMIQSYLHNVCHMAHLADVVP